MGSLCLIQCSSNHIAHFQLFVTARCVALNVVSMPPICLAKRTSVCVGLCVFQNDFDELYGWKLGEPIVMFLHQPLSCPMLEGGVRGDWEKFLLTNIIERFVMNLCQALCTAALYVFSLFLFYEPWLNYCFSPSCGTLKPSTPIDQPIKPKCASKLRLEGFPSSFLDFLDKTMTSYCTEEASLRVYSVAQ